MVLSLKDRGSLLNRFFFLSSFFQIFYLKGFYSLYISTTVLPVKYLIRIKNIYWHRKE